MYRFTAFTMLSIVFLYSVPAASSPLSYPLGKRSYSGTATWFIDGLGACGWQSADSDPIVALSTELYGSGANCGQWVSITNADGVTVYAKVVDECMGCGTYDLDLSSGLFEQLGPLKTGVLPIDWTFLGQ